MAKTGWKESSQYCHYLLFAVLCDHDVGFRSAQPARYDWHVQGISILNTEENFAMNKRERVTAAFRGQEVDHVPVCMWQHVGQEYWGDDEYQNSSGAIFCI